MDENFYQKTKVKFVKEEFKPTNPKNWPKEWKTIYFKEYPRLPKIFLPKPESLKFLLEESLTKRKSEREFSKKPVGLNNLSQLLFYSAGIIEEKEKDWNKTRRVYPSGGARFPLEVYLCIFEKNRELEKGIYHYNVKEHSLERILQEEKLGELIYPEIIWQEMIKEAPMLLAIAGVFERNTIKYKERGYRYIFNEVGHLGQNIYLVSTALGIKCCAIGGFDDDRFNKLLDIDGQVEGVLYAFALGY